ncbi:MAG: HIT family protein [Desulfobacteraceae bacterium]|nr:HIT family protein [Desulfobacterales bacterium]MBL6968328.1 HIT family protein [Desulfobacteraceae bacterium]MBL7102254.1 HIT family protein [Desulfobacteraceae bacterium]MBL7171289.1 HIT family protein [Desulfobacteraceae bacterium]
MDACIFCKIVKGEIPSFKVYEDEKVFAFEDINPISPGHTLIIPRRHAQDLWEIPGDDLMAVHLASKKIIAAIQEALNPSGVACVQLNGPGANQVVLHYHLHLIPRIAGGPELPVATWELKQGDMEAIKETADRIAAALRFIQAVPHSSTDSPATM